MTEHDQQQPPVPAPQPTPLDLPAERLREPSSDELPVELPDTNESVPLDDSERVREDAGLFEI